MGLGSSEASAQSIVKQAGFDPNFFFALPAEARLALLQAAIKAQQFVHHTDRGGDAMRFNEISGMAAALPELEKQLKSSSSNLRLASAIDAVFSETRSKFDASEQSYASALGRFQRTAAILLGTDKDRHLECLRDARIVLAKNVPLTVVQVRALLESGWRNKELVEYMSATRQQTLSLTLLRELRIDNSGGMQFWSGMQRESSPDSIIFGAAKPESDVSLRTCRIIVGLEEVLPDEVRSASQRGLSRSQRTLSTRHFIELDSDFRQPAALIGEHLLTLHVPPKEMPVIRDEGVIVRISGPDLEDCRDLPAIEEIVFPAPRSLTFQAGSDLTEFEMAKAALIALIERESRRPDFRYTDTVQIFNELSRRFAGGVTKETLLRDRDVVTAFEGLLTLAMKNPLCRTSAEDLCSMFGCDYRDFPEACAQGLLGQFVQESEPNFQELTELVASVANHCPQVFDRSDLREAFIGFAARTCAHSDTRKHLKIILSHIRCYHESMDNWVADQLAKVSCDEQGIDRAVAISELITDSKGLGRIGSVQSKMNDLLSWVYHQFEIVPAQAAHSDAGFRLLISRIDIPIRIIMSSLEQLVVKPLEEGSMSFVTPWEKFIFPLLDKEYGGFIRRPRVKRTLHEFFASGPGITSKLSEFADRVGLRSAFIQGAERYVLDVLGKGLNMRTLREIDIALIHAPELKSRAAVREALVECSSNLPEDGVKVVEELLKTSKTRRKTK